MIEPDNQASTQRKATIERCFAAYNAKDRATVERLLTSTFTFTSPYDDGIDRAIETQATQYAIDYSASPT
ncbi:MULTISPECIES: hypothetical protein [unclassified Microcoleus]|uniref:hypothetical protein n=1 Tax=unclassified Microcoleus TaxID=2642155 RepID=UPI002FD4293D